VCLDCDDAESLADFYARLLGWEIAASDGSGWVQLRDPAGGVAMNIQAESWYRPPTWPEVPGGQDKMLHLEILVDDLDAAVTHAASVGATVADHQPPDRATDRLRVMVDPAGHPFCLFTAGE
jgi:predicted enzyme related to lactoylglutathione lyase